MVTYPPIKFTFADREDWSVPKVLEHRSRSHRDKPFLREGEGAGRSWTYEETYRLANSVGRGLSERGLVRGDRLAIMLENRPEYLMAWFGASMVGVVEVPINTEYTGQFLENSMNLMAPRAVVVSPRFVQVFVDSRSKLSSRLTFFVVGDGAELGRALASLAEAGWAAEPFDDLTTASDEPHDVKLERHELGAIISTSGTTGPSKGVMMSHNQLYFFAEQHVSVVGLRESDVYQCATPLFHGNAQFLATYPALIVGATVVLYERFSPSRFLSRVREAGITVTNLVGVMMDWVCREPETDSDRDNSLRVVESTPAPAALSATFRERFDVDFVATVFGQTEICLPILSPYGEERPDGAAGVLVDEFFEVRLVNPATDEDVPEGEMGELVLRAKEPHLINSGYYGMPDATADAHRDGWFHTGDGLRRDQDGWYFFVDRTKDALRRRGENISSFEVEQAVLGHPDVDEVAVTGCPAEYEGGEDEIVANVVLASGADLQEIIAWADSTMPRFLVPRYWRIVSSLPKTPSEKIRKAALRQAGIDDAFDRLAPSGSISTATTE